jgi:hypothetical protein
VTIVRIGRVDAAHVGLTELDPLCCELLRRIPSHVDMRDAAVRFRLFPSPSDGREPEFDAEWESYVEPSLRQLFQTSLETIREDLQMLQPPETPGGEDGVLRIPLTHLEAWIHGLNQARIALAARHGFAETEAERLELDSTDPRAIALFHIEFYAMLMEWFLRELEGE